MRSDWSMQLDSDSSFMPPLVNSIESISFFLFFFFFFFFFLNNFVEFNTDSGNYNFVIRLYTTVSLYFKVI